MDEQQIKMWIAAERGCFCETCNRGYWLKDILSWGRVPDDLVLYHKSGVLVNNKVADINLRCVRCSKSPELTKTMILEKWLTPVKPKSNIHKRMWINDGQVNKKVIKAEVPDGWQRGKIMPDSFFKNKPRVTRGCTGMRWITNGAENKLMTFKSRKDKMPVGWRLGITMGDALVFKKGVLV